MTKTINLNPNKSNPQKKEIDIKLSKPLLCSECLYDVFLDAMKFRKISKLLTGTPQDMIFPVEIFVCGQCGAVNKELLPEQLKELDKNEK